VSEFRDPLVIAQTGWQDGRALWRTRAALRYQSDYLGEVLIIPDDFITDLGSVPRWPLVFWLAGGRGHRSAVLHDFPYQFRFWITGEGERLEISRRDADAVYHESLLADPWSGTTAAVARQMWLGVRVGGRSWSDRTRVRALNPQWAQDWAVA